MPPLPSDLTGRQVQAALERIGFRVSRQRGSHIMLYKEHPHIAVVVPDHKTVRVGTLRKIIRDARLSVDEFLRLLR